MGASPALYAVLVGPEHRLETANAAFLDAMGIAEGFQTGQPLGRLVPGVVQGFVEPLDQVYRTGRPHNVRDARVRLGAREAFFDLTHEPWHDVGGAVAGVRVMGVETTATRHAHRLAVEQRALLEQIARQAPLEQILEGMVEVIERLSPGVLASVLLADDDGAHLRHGAAPSLPDFYNQAIDGIATGEGVGSCGTAAHRRAPVVVADIATHPFWDDFRDLADLAGLAACWSTPVLSSQGRLLGTFAIYHRIPRAPEPQELALCEVFAEIAALAVERHHAERAREAAEARAEQAREDLAFLLKAGAWLTDVQDDAQALQRLADLCAPALAPLCVVEVVESGRLRRVGLAAPDPDVRELLASCPSVQDGDDAPGRVLVSGVTETVRRAPTGHGPWKQLGVNGYVRVPLIDRGQVFGAVTLFSTVSSTERPVLDGRTVHLAEELARRTVTAVRNARQYVQRARLARDLQAGLLLPDLPALPGAELATHYRAAGEGLEVGGDFYDVFPLGGDRWAFMIGDVCGRGAIAATTTALVRSTARAVARLLPDPASVVRAVNAALLERPDSHGNGFVTMVYGHLRHTGDRLAVELIRAGHVAPRIVRHDGAVEVRSVPGMLLGLLDTPNLTPHRLDLRPGDSLVLVTDGITEARSADGGMLDDSGLDAALAGVLTGRPAGPPGARRILDHLTGAVHAFTGGAVVDDDQAILILTADSEQPRSP